MSHSNPLTHHTALVNPDTITAIEAAETVVGAVNQALNQAAINQELDNQELDNQETRSDLPHNVAASPKSSWTALAPPVDEGAFIEPPFTVIQQFICKAFTESAFLKHNQIRFAVDSGEIRAFVDQSPHLIGNASFNILHGGVAATMLDSLGGAFAMGEIYRRAETDWADRMKKTARLATVDMRVDYISPGRGKFYVGTAEVLRMGRKGCTVRVNMHNDEQKLIATAMVSYAY